MARRILIRIGMLFAFVLIVLIGWLVWFFHFGVDARDERFEANLWNERANVYSVSNDPGCVRGGMAVDLLKRNLLLAKSSAEVNELLGRPDKSDSASISYELGQCSGFGWESSILRVGFDENGKVKRAKIERDAP
jgi:hypothetical protein